MLQALSFLYIVHCIHCLSFCIGIGMLDSIVGKLTKVGSFFSISSTRLCRAIVEKQCALSFQRDRHQAELD